MSWSLYRWTWQLESPLYLGMLPAGSVNRCRLYVPARAMWAAVTAEIARTQAKSGFPEYDQVGEQIRKQVRFTYLFPAEKIGKEWCAWLPRYLSTEGLVWECKEAPDRRLPDRQFRMLLLSTRPSTAIDPASHTAAEGSLHETECINTRWRDEHGRPGGPVALIGYVFLHDGLEEKLRTTLKDLEAIAIGGDTRYGLGQLRRVEKTGVTSVFGCAVGLSRDEPEIVAKRIFGHAAVNGKAPGNLHGEMELLRGWDYGKNKPWCTERPLWMPGSCTEAEHEWRIEDFGHWSCTTQGKESANQERLD